MLYTFGSKINMQVINNIIDRFSPYTFTTELIDSSYIELLFQSAAMAASSYNEQPWRFIYASKEDSADFDKFLNLLMPGNHKMAAQSAVIAFSFARKNYDLNGNTNMHNWHDVGLAMGNLCNQATSMGISVHQMGGIERTKIRTQLHVPETYDIVAGMAIGYSDEKHNNKEKKSMGQYLNRNTWKWNN